MMVIKEIMLMVILEMVKTVIGVMLKEWGEVCQEMVEVAVMMVTTPVVGAMEVGVVADVKVATVTQAVVVIGVGPQVRVAMVVATMMMMTCLAPMALS